MIVRLLLAGGVMVVLATAVARGGASWVLWEAGVLVLFVVAVWRRAPAAPAPAPPLLFADVGFPIRPHHTLSALELEVADALDPRLSGDGRVRRRLLRLAAAKVGLADGDLAAHVGRGALGNDVWEILTSEHTPLTLDELDLVVGRIEAL